MNDQPIPENGAADQAASPPGQTFRPVDGPAGEIRLLRKEANERLPCKLTEEEKLDWGKRLADNLNRISAVEDQLAAYKQQAKAEIEKLSAEVRHASHLVSTGVEYREVPTEIILDYVRGVKDIFRKDTGEAVVTGVLLTTQEKQLELSIGTPA